MAKEERSFEADGRAVPAGTNHHMESFSLATYLLAGIRIGIMLMHFVADSGF